MTRDGARELVAHSRVQEVAIRLVFQIRVTDDGGTHLPDDCACLKGFFNMDFEKEHVDFNKRVVPKHPHPSYEKIHQQDEHDSGSVPCS